MDRGRTVRSLELVKQHEDLRLSIPGKTAGMDAVVGIGSVITCDAPDRTIALGPPARQHGRTQED